MKAVTYTRYGPPEVLRLEEVEKPPVHDEDVLVRARAASLNPYDWHFLTGKPYILRLMLGGLRRPKFTRLGGDLAGEVEAVGAKVKGFRPGDPVFGCVNGATRRQLLLELGSCAEYVCVAEDHLALKPPNLTFEEAAAAPIAALTALNGLRDSAHLQPGQSVLINGASGGVGLFAVQIAKLLGAEVTGVCSARNVELVRSLGADRVVDYTREDFTRGGERYDLLFDNVGNHPLRACLRVLKPKGIYLMSFGRPENRWLGPFLRLIGARLLAPFVGPKLVELNWEWRGPDLQRLKDDFAAGTIRPVVDRTYPLSETAEAMRYLQTGHARAKVVVTM